MFKSIIYTMKNRLGLSPRLLHALSVLAGMFTFALIVLFVSYHYVGTPKEWLLKREAQEYAEKIAALNIKVNKLDARLNEIAQRDDELYRTNIGLSPIPDELRKAGMGGAERYKSLEALSNSEVLISTFQSIDRLGRELYVQSESFDKINRKLKRRVDSLNAIPAIQPISVRDLKYISSKYGFRDHPKLHRWIKHTGIDFAAKKGTPIYATGDGVVEEQKTSMCNYGKMVMINHGYGYETRYAHMSKKLVKPGQRVKRGQLIGYVGHSGRTTGDHLHYEVLVNGHSVNPKAFYLKDQTAEEYDDMIFVLSMGK